VTGPVTDPPPSGPGKDFLDEYDLQLATVGCEVIDPLAAWAEAVAAAAPPLTADQRAGLARLLGGPR
jgi:hypothetical protein